MKFWQYKPVRWQHFEMDGACFACSSGASLYRGHKKVWWANQANY